VVRVLVGARRDALKLVHVALALKGRVLGLVEPSRHEFGHEALWIVDDEGTAVRLPADNVRLSFGFEFVQDALELEGETRLKSIAAATNTIVVVVVVVACASVLTCLAGFVVGVLHSMESQSGLFVVIVNSRTCWTNAAQSTAASAGRRRRPWGGRSYDYRSGSFASIFAILLMVVAMLLVMRLFVGLLVQLEVLVARSVFADQVLNRQRGTGWKARKIWFLIRITSCPYAVAVHFLTLHATAQKLHAPEKLFVVVASLIVAHL